MDAHSKGADQKGASAGEVRRINVVYFLSRGGRTDHPHLFRVNHLNRAGGVRLRDVKRWLSELRGKGMPDNYSWSYKRRYKTGYVWQDLKDEDLITPTSDNEYVLKGCDVRGTPPPCVQAPRRTSSQAEKKKQVEEETPRNQDHRVEVVLSQDSDESSPNPPPPAADQDSPPGGCESARRGTAPFKVEEPPQGLREQRQHQHQEVVIKIDVSRSQSQELPEQQKQRQAEEEEVAATAAKAVAQAAPREEQGAAGGARSRHALGYQSARRMRVARALHNMLTCGASDADDSALHPLARRQQRGAAEGGCDEWPPHTPTCPGMDGCGLRVSRKAARSRRGGKDKQQGKRERERERDAHKPATLPRCSQCGKEFKPQELHAHMQSCRGFKERMRSSTSSRASVDRRRSSAAAAHHRGKPDDDHCSSERPSSASAVFLLTES